MYRMLLVEAVRILRQRPSRLYKSRLARSLFKLSLVLAEESKDGVAEREEAHDLWREMIGGQCPPDEEENGIRFFLIYKISRFHIAQ